MGAEQLETSMKRLEQKATSWKANVKRIYPDQDSEVLYDRIRPFSKEAEKLMLDSLAFSFGNLCSMKLEDLKIEFLRKKSIHNDLLDERFNHH